MAETSLACEFAARSRNEPEACWRRDGSRFRSLKYCAGCGELAERISQGTGAPLLGSREGGERYYAGYLPGFWRIAGPTIVEGTGA